MKYKLYRFQVQLWHIGIVVHDGPTANKLLKVRILFERGCKCHTSCESGNERSHDRSLSCTDLLPLVFAALEKRPGEATDVCCGDRITGPPCFVTAITHSPSCFSSHVSVNCSKKGASPVRFQCYDHFNVHTSRCLNLLLFP